MTGMRATAKVTGSILIACALLFVRPAAQSKPAAEETPAPAAPIRLPLTKLTPEASIAVKGEKTFVSGPDAMWILNRTTAELLKVDAKTNAIASTMKLESTPCASALIAFGSLWIGDCKTPAIVRIDPAASKVAAKIAVPASGAVGAFATAVGSVWTIIDRRGTLVRIDPDTNQIVAEVYLSAGSSAMAFGEGALWIADSKANTVTRVNPFTNVIGESVAVGKGPIAIAVGGGAVWSLNGADGTISRIDPKTNKVAATIKAGTTGASGAIVVGEGTVWASVPGQPLSRIDATANRLLQQFSGPGGGEVAIGFRSLWIAPTADTVWRIDPKRVEATR